jgi:hypothetical protein
MFKVAFITSPDQPAFGLFLPPVAGRDASPPSSTWADGPGVCHGRLPDAPA